MGWAMLFFIYWLTLVEDETFWLQMEAKERYHGRLSWLREDGRRYA